MVHKHAAPFPPHAPPYVEYVAHASRSHAQSAMWNKQVDAFVAANGSGDMNLLFASGMPYLPQALGGIEINTDQLAIELSRRGHQTAVLARLWLRDHALALHASRRIS